MDKLKAMSTFVAIVDQGSLSAAADKLGRSPAAVVRTLASLEQHLGVRLLNRSTRRIALTDEGREYLDHCRRILADIQSGKFTSEWMQECKAGQARFKGTRRLNDSHQIEEVGEKLRGMMPWIKSNALVDKEKN